MNSNLQVISGEYRGRKLYLPACARPTQNRARIAIFNMLTEILPSNENIVVWDAFGGSGAMGIEILSRYQNSTAIFTDLSDKSLQTIKKNTNVIAANRICIAKADATKVIAQYGKNANLIFVDPPYENAQMGIDFVTNLADMVAPNTIVVQEIENIVPYSPDTAKWNILRDKVYGRARFVILCKKCNK